MIVAVASRFPFIQRRPSLRLLLWMFVLLKLVTPPLIEIRLPVLHASSSQTMRASSSQAAPIAVNEDAIEEPAMESLALPTSAMNWIVGLPIVVSILGTAVLWFLSVRQGRRIARALAYGHTEDDRLNQFVQECARRLGMKTAPTVCVVEASLSPMLWVKLSGPIVVLPRTFLDAFNDDQLRCVVGHEIAHWIRRDHWTNFVSLFIVTLCWWNPVAWWARRELQLGQELCCDSLVVNAGLASRRGYAETLYTALELTQPDRPCLLAFASGFGGRSFVRRRFQMIANQGLQHRLSWWTCPVVVLGALILPSVLVPAVAGEIKLSECPNAVQKTIKREAGKGRIEEVSFKSEKGIYEADVVVKDHEYEMQINADGTLLQKVLDEDDDEADEQDEADDEKKHMQVGKSKGSELNEPDEDEVRVKFDDLPESIRKTLKQEVAKGEIEEIVKEREKDRTVFEVSVEIDEQDYELKIAENGLLISKILESEEDEDDEDDDV